jgi:hypothetical protein
VSTSEEPRDALARRVRDLLAVRDVREVRMFGGVSFMMDERLAVAAGRDGDLLVHVDPAEYESLLARGAVPAVMGTDRPMGGGWVSVPRQRIEEDAELAYWVGIGVGLHDPSA